MHFLFLSQPLYPYDATGTKEKDFLLYNQRKSQLLTDRPHDLVKKMAKINPKNTTPTPNLGTKKKKKN